MIGRASESCFLTSGGSTPVGRRPVARLTAARTSLVAASMSRSRSKVRLMRVSASSLEEEISSMPTIPES